MFNEVIVVIIGLWPSKYPFLGSLSTPINGNVLIIVAQHRSRVKNPATKKNASLA